jgi:DNA repair protein RecO (recombination protein O)
MRFPFLELALAAAARLERLVGDAEPDEDLFGRTLEYLRALTRAARSNDMERGQILSAGYYFQIARHLGYGSELRRCVTCGEPVREGERLILSLEAGGILHAEHSGANALPVSPAAVKLLRLFADVPLLKLEKIVAGEKPAGEVTRLAARAFSWIAP